MYILYTMEKSLDSAQIEHYELEEKEMTAKVENYCARKRTMGINIDVSERMCGTCIWYEQYYREGRGKMYVVKGKADRLAKYNIAAAHLWQKWHKQL